MYLLKVIEKQITFIILLYASAVLITQYSLFLALMAKGGIDSDDEASNSSTGKPQTSTSMPPMPVTGPGPGMGYMGPMPPIPPPMGMAPMGMRPGMGPMGN